jgi:hypothetical protein
MRSRISQGIVTLECIVRSARPRARECVGHTVSYGLVTAATTLANTKSLRAAVLELWYTGGGLYNGEKK